MTFPVTCLSLILKRLTMLFIDCYLDYVLNFPANLTPNCHAYGPTANCTPAPHSCPNLCNTYTFVSLYQIFSIQVMASINSVSTVPLGFDQFQFNSLGFQVPVPSLDPSAGCFNYHLHTLLLAFLFLLHRTADPQL